MLIFIMTMLLAFSLSGIASAWGTEAEVTVSCGSDSDEDYIYDVAAINY